MDDLPLELFTFLPSTIVTAILPSPMFESTIADFLDSAQCPLLEHVEVSGVDFDWESVWYDLTTLQDTCNRNPGRFDLQLYRIHGSGLSKDEWNGRAARVRDARLEWMWGVFLFTERTPS